MPFRFTQSRRLRKADSTSCRRIEVILDRSTIPLSFHPDFPYKIRKEEENGCTASPPFQVLNHLNPLYENWYDSYASGGNASRLILICFSRY